ncbi:uncharacterized protein LOC113359728 [Papaver somniferum]|uniref:uncharacterized protein LOC113359728 n=1 Tax=Papaver somniferum TaxID=3469 RepID=UPI000E7003BF|nr:uncharacterized protein LOC113359728 [Papaver somniferum]
MLVESPSEPKWSSKGELFFITNRKNRFWNLYNWIEHRSEVVSVYSIIAEFTKLYFDDCSFDFIPTNGNNNLIACSYRQFGKSYLEILDVAQNSPTFLDDTFTDISNILRFRGVTVYTFKEHRLFIPISSKGITLSFFFNIKPAFLYK